MRPTALLVWAFLLPCILGKEDHDGFPKLSNEHLNQTVIKSVVTTVEAEQVRQRTRRSEVFPRLDYKNNVHLKWVKWYGFLPQWAVKVYIPGTRRQDYICAPRNGCHWSTGYYNPFKGPFCFNPCNGKEDKSSRFDILVNEQNLELLEWKVFKNDINSVTSWAGNNYDRLSVGKNRDGVGYIYNEKFYLPYNAREYYYDTNFDVLTLQTCRYKQKIYDIQYQVNELKMHSQQPTTFDQMRVTNHNFREITQLVQLQASIERQSTWGNSVSNTLAASASMTVSIPVVDSATAGVTFSYSNSKTVTNGNSLTETISSSLSEPVTVPPNHSCLVKMTGKRFKFDIPYKARLSKEYTNGKVHSTTVSGTYHGVQVGDIHAVKECCVRIPNAQPYTP